MEGSRGYASGSSTASEKIKVLRWKFALYIFSAKGICLLKGCVKSKNKVKRENSKVGHKELTS